VEKEVLMGFLAATEDWYTAREIFVEEFGALQEKMANSMVLLGSISCLATLLRSPHTVRPGLLLANPNQLKV
jgi:hypothetical protein